MEIDEFPFYLLMNNKEAPMFNQRQLEIVLELFENQGTYMTASYFAGKQQVSLRTIQNDIRQIKDELSKNSCVSFQSAAPRGSRIIVQDPDAFSILKDTLYQQFSNTSLNYQNERINQILLLLLKQHRAMSMYDIENTVYVSHNTLLNDLKRVAEVLAEAVFAHLGKEFFLRIPDSEIDYLALYMKGQGNPSTSSVISQEMDDLVLDILREIRSAFEIDLTNDLNLRISLALHCSSLIVRIRYDMQLKNHLTDYIRQTFPQGYDIATYFASCLQKRFHQKVKDEEIAFLAIHLYKSLMEQQNNAGTKRVLVISSLRRSENLLLRQTLSNWFTDQIAELAFIPPAEVDESCLDHYDTFITTEKGRFYDMGLALYINQFPEKQDYLNLKLAMDGFESINDIL